MAALEERAAQAAAQAHMPMAQAVVHGAITAGRAAQAGMVARVEERAAARAEMADRRLESRSSVVRPPAVPARSTIPVTRATWAPVIRAHNPVPLNVPAEREPTEILVSSPIRT